MSDGVRLDLHVHSTHSPDSNLPVETIIGRLAYQGLRGFALTDHDTVRGHVELARLRGKYSAYLFLPGVEVSTANGHLLAFGVAEPPPPRRPVAETIEWVRAHGGEGVPAHPFRWSHGIGRTLVETVPVPAIEVRNGHNSEIANLRAEEVAARRGIGATGGSDAHELRDLGRAYTEFDASVGSVDDLLEEIRKGRTLGDGKSMPFGGRLRLGLRTSVLRAARGFRPI
jgi:predicted metal-dependent phosphoesterase TrpH